MIKVQQKYLRSEDRASNRDESAVELRMAIRGSDDGSRCQQSDFGAHSDVAIRSRGNKLWESLRESRVSDAHTLYRMYQGTNLP